MSEREARQRNETVDSFPPRSARNVERALRWSAAACLAVVAACLAPHLSDTSARSFPPAAKPNLQGLTLQVRDARTKAPLAGATIARARAKNWDELSSDVDATFAHFGIAGNAGRYLALSREESLPAQPGTEGQPPFAPRDESVIATTDRDGRGMLAVKLPDDEYIVIRCPNRGARYISVAETNALAHAELAVDMHPLAQLRVRVHTLEGEAIEDAYLRVEAVPFLPEYRPQRTLPLIDGLAWRGPTDARGEFELTDLTVDEALIITPLSRCIGKAKTLVLTEGALESACDLIVVAPGSITGRVVGLDGKAVSGALIGCQPRRPWSSNWTDATTDDDGTFSLNSLPCGPQQLNCTPGYQGGYALTNENPFEVRVEPFSRTDVGDLVFGEQSVCSGRIVGLPHEGEGEFNRTRFELTQGHTTFSASDLKPDGSFQFFAPPGAAKVQLILNTDWDAGRPIVAETVTLPCEGVELDVTHRLATLAFHLQLSAGEELASATIYDHELDEHNGTPKWQGALSRFEFDRDGDGENYLVKTLLSGHFRLELELKGGAKSWCGDVELEDGKLLDLGLLSLGTAALSGSLVGAPPDSVVDLVRRVPGMFGKGAFGEQRFDHRTSAVAIDGTFHFDSIPAGLWCATANCAGARLVDGSPIDLRVGDAKTLTLRASRTGSVRCRIRRGPVPVSGAVLTYSFASETYMRPFFELNPKLKLRPSDCDGLIELKTLFPGPYWISIELGDSRLNRYVELAWGDERELDFDFGTPEFALALDLPEDLRGQVQFVTYWSMADDGLNAGLRVQAARVGLNTFTLRAPPSNGYVSLSIEDNSTIMIPLTLREDPRKIELALPRGEIVLRVGNESNSWYLPDVMVIELPGGRRVRDSKYGTLPMEQLPDGRWLVRGVPEGSTVRIQPGDQRLRFGPPPRFIHFESGRLEVSWP